MNTTSGKWTILFFLTEDGFTEEWQFPFVDFKGILKNYETKRLYTSNISE